MRSFRSLQLFRNDGSSRIAKSGSPRGAVSLVKCSACKHAFKWWQMQTSCVQYRTSREAMRSMQRQLAEAQLTSLVFSPLTLSPQTGRLLRRQNPELASTHRAMLYGL